MKTVVNKGLIAAALLLATAGVTFAQGTALEIGGFVRETLPGLSTSAAYLELKNHAREGRSLTGVEIAQSAQALASLHTTVERDGISRMRPVEALAIPAGQSVKMAPGGLHVMLEGVKLRAGDNLSLRLLFANGEIREVVLPVRGLQADSEHHHHHQHG
ncbi:hypothetical protein AUP74_01321 [Microbulbifer aggregans]|uniref:Copper chaperone PCu(A)C n=1 Tax=Microbulbifer aggregans TaxID=1769779 RepID=A0A1C9W6M2_9GAMM|nr:copper chaperone PCu(A)C [Microbulbifer aggregans]AOS96780.1 hypothetical protein AUP74_01321 [Microbulbifer aggregans]